MVSKIFIIGIVIILIGLFLFFVSPSILIHSELGKEFKQNILQFQHGTLAEIGPSTAFFVPYNSTAGYYSLIYYNMSSPIQVKLPSSISTSKVPYGTLGIITSGSGNIIFYNNNSHPVYVYYSIHRIPFTASLEFIMFPLIGMLLIFIGIILTIIGIIFTIKKR